MKPINTLLSGVAALALLATPVMAQSTDAGLSAETNTTIATGNDGMTANSDTKTHTDDLGDELSDATSATGDAIERGADATANAAGEAWDATKETASDMAQGTGEAIENGTDKMASGMESLGDAVAPSTATAGTLIGTEVTSDSGETIGEVDNVVLVQGKEMAVVGVGGFLGLGEHDVALPLEELSSDGEQLHASGYTKEQLESMAEFNPETATEVNAEEPVMLGKS